MKKLSMLEIPVDIINHYRCDKREIHSATKKGAIRIIVKTKDGVRAVWKLVKGSWEMESMGATCYESPIRKSRVPVNTLFGQPIPERVR